MLKRSSLALLALGIATGHAVLDSSAAIANPNPLPNVDAIIFAETVENFTQGYSSNWNGSNSTIHDRDHERWINGHNNAEAALGANVWESDMTHAQRLQVGS